MGAKRERYERLAFVSMAHRVSKGTHVGDLFTGLVVVAVFFLVMWLGGTFLGRPLRAVGRGIVWVVLFLPWLLIVYPLALLLGLSVGFSLNNRDGGD